jgi:hypothetical protein
MKWRLCVSATFAIEWGGTPSGPTARYETKPVLDVPDHGPTC